MATKKIPYGISDFQRLSEDDYYYVDKTRFIEEVEKSPELPVHDSSPPFRKIVVAVDVIELLRHPYG